MRKNNDTTDPIAETAEEAESYEKSKDEFPFNLTTFQFNFFCFLGFLDFKDVDST